jgi:beta-lactamase class A
MKHFQPQRNNRHSITTPQYYQPRRPYATIAPQTITPKHHRYRWWLVASVGLLGIAGFTYTFFAPADSHSQAHASHVQQAATTPAIAAALKSRVNAILAQNGQYDIGIALTNTSTGQTQTFGDTSPFVAASTAKVLAACAYYHLVETGQANLNDPMGNYTAQFQIQEMINDSDNTSWDLIAAAIGSDQLQAYADSIGITGFSEANNTLTPEAMATMLTKLYTGSLLNQADTQQLLSYMQNTNDETLIPAALPSSITVYHKYGLLDDELHDASILVKGSQAYSLVIYTKSNAGYDDDDARTALIHQLTQSIVETIFPGSYSG